MYRATSTRTRFLFILTALALMLPLVNGCSTFGIATVDDLDAAESRMQTANRATTSRIEALEQSNADMQTSVQQVTANFAELQKQFDDAKTWLEGIDLEHLAETSKTAEARSQAIVDGYLQWAKDQRNLLDEQIKAIEASQSKKDAPPPATDTPLGGNGN